MTQTIRGLGPPGPNGVQGQSPCVPALPAPKWRRLLWPAIATFILFWILIALGVWQMHRLKWKEGLLAVIHHAEISAPVAAAGASDAV